MKKKLFSILGVVLIVATLFTGCDWEDEADVASYNISKEADNFNIYRKIAGQLY